MTFSDWLSDTRTRVSEDGLSGAKRSVLELGVGGVRRLDRRFPFGQPIYDRNWDVLIILDACRADLMAEVEEDYSFVDTESMTSLAGGSRTWMQRNFAEEYRDDTRETTYVTGNPFSDDVLVDEWFENMEEVWKYAWDDELNTVPARSLTDVAIHEHRQSDPNRMIVHYMQPHHPFVPNPMDSGMNKGNLKDPADPIWQQIKKGEADPDEVWEAYRENLRYVLDDVSLLLRNLDAESVVVSADHGNAIGEWGFYGHGDVPISAVREVPWCETTAKDTGEHEPELEPQDDELAVEDKLEDLGYL